MNETATEEYVEESEGEESKGSKIPAEIIDAFEAGIQAEKDEDPILIDMLQAGAPFGKVKRMYNELMIEAGLALSKKDKDAILESAFENADLSTEEGFDAVVTAVREDISYATEKSAATMVRAYARKKDIEYFKRPKGEGTRKDSFVKVFCDWVLENPHASKEAVDTFIEASPNKLSKKFMSRWYAINDMANAIRNS